MKEGGQPKITREMRARRNRKRKIYTYIYKYIYIYIYIYIYNQDEQTFVINKESEKKRTRAWGLLEAQNKGKKK